MFEAVESSEKYETDKGSSLPSTAATLVRKTVYGMKTTIEVTCMKHTLRHTIPILNI